MLRQNIALKHERRIGKYGIDPINDDSSSMLDRLTDKYFDFVFRVRPYLKKSGLIVRMSKKYEKYVAYGKDDL